MVQSNRKLQNFNQAISNCGLFIFDLDGTLLDVRFRYVKTIQDSMTFFGLKKPSYLATVKLKRQGLTGLQVIKTFADGLSDSLLKKVDEKRVGLLNKKGYLRFDKVFCSCDALLTYLTTKRKKLVILTTRTNINHTVKQLESLCLIKFFCMIYFVDPSGDVFTNKVSAIKEIRDKLGITSICVIGDSKSEIEAGNNLNCVTVATLSGLTSKQLLVKSKPTFTINTIAQLIENT